MQPFNPCTHKIASDEILISKDQRLYFEKRVHYKSRCWIVRFLTQWRYDQSKVLEALHQMACEARKAKNWDASSKIESNYFVVLRQTKAQNRSYKKYSAIRRFFLMKTHVYAKPHVHYFHKIKQPIELKELQLEYDQILQGITEHESHISERSNFLLQCLRNCQKNFSKYTEDQRKLIVQYKSKIQALPQLLECAQAFAVFRGENGGCHANRAEFLINKAILLEDLVQKLEAISIKTRLLTEVKAALEELKAEMKVSLMVEGDDELEDPILISDFGSNFLVISTMELFIEWLGNLKERLQKETNPDRKLLSMLEQCERASKQVSLNEHAAFLDKIGLGKVKDWKNNQINDINSLYKFVIKNITKIRNEIIRL